MSETDRPRMRRSKFFSFVLDREKLRFLVGLPASASSSITVIVISATRHVRGVGTEGREETDRTRPPATFSRKHPLGIGRLVRYGGHDRPLQLSLVPIPPSPSSTVAVATAATQHLLVVGLVHLRPSVSEIFTNSG